LLLGVEELKKVFQLAVISDTALADPPLALAPPLLAGGTDGALG
jgi:hypothetical protein